MNYLLRNRDKERRNVPFVRALKITIIFLLVVAVISYFFPNFFYRLFEPVSVPVLRAKEAIYRNLNSTFSFLTSKSSLIEENRRLKEQLLEKNILLLDYDKLAQENKNIKLIVESSPENSYLARIIAGPSESPYDIFLLETGGFELTVGDKIYGIGNVILGEVIESYGKTARARLYSSSGLETNAVHIQSGSTLTLIGAGGGNFSVVVPKDLKISEKEIVALPGYESRILAVVGSIDETEADSFKKVYLAYPLNIFELEWVLIKR